MTRRTTFAAVALGITLSRVARAEEASPAVPVSPMGAVAVWTAMQLVPSPLFVVGTGNAGGGVRWQLAPLVYSFGVADKPVRAFVVEPVARHSGAVEFYVSPEWACCAREGTSWLGRAGVRLHAPLVGRGESLSASIGASYYRASGGGGFSTELGAYVLFGTIGLTITFSPELEGRETIVALALRYF